MKEETKRLYGNPEGGYNGWKNYATWNIALWLGNDEGLYNLLKEKAACKAYQGYKKGRQAKNFVLRYLPVTDDGINATHRGIDWEAIAEAMRDMAA